MSAREKSTVPEISENAEEDRSKVQVDRRRDLRTPLIVLKVKIESDRKTFFGYAKNISRSGMFIATVNPADPGTRFAVEIPLPDRTDVQVRCRCEVVWKRLYSERGHYEPGMGLRFTDIPEDTARAIEDWVHSSDEK